MERLHGLLTMNVKFYNGQITLNQRLTENRPAKKHMKARVAYDLSLFAPSGCFQSVPGALQWLLSHRTHNFLEMAHLLWCLLVLSLKSTKEIDQQLLKARIIGAADVHLQYMQELEAEPSSISGASAELLTAVLAEVPPLLCIATFNYISQSEHFLYDTGLVQSPGVLNAAMLQLVGLAKYLHTLHIDKQSLGQEAGGGAGSSSKSSGSTPATSSRRPAKVIGASSFAQLQLPADHEGVKVVGGGRAVAAVSKRLERRDREVGTDGWDMIVSGNLSTAMFLFRIAVDCRLTSDSSSASSRCSGDSSSSGGGCTSGGIASSSSSTRPRGSSSDTIGAVQLGSRSHAEDMAAGCLGVPWLQLLLQLRALVGSFQLRIFRKCEPLKLFLLAEEAETVGFLSAKGGLLLQVLWLMAEGSSQRQQEDGEVLWLNVFSACHLNVFMEPHASSSLGEFLGPVLSSNVVSNHVLLRGMVHSTHDFSLPVWVESSASLRWEI